MRLLPQNTIPLPAVSVRQGRHGHSRMPHHNQPTGPETDRCVLPGSAALRQSHFLWKCFFFRNMAIFVQLRKIFPEPFLRKVKFIVHKAVPVAPPAKARDTPGWQSSVLPRRPQYWRFTPAGCFPFFTKHVSSTDSIPGACPTCLESSSW